VITLGRLGPAEQLEDAVIAAQPKERSNDAWQ
jgi:hypothetical protein